MMTVLLHECSGRFRLVGDGNGNRSGMKEQTRNALTQHWDEAKEQFKAAFGVSDEDLGDGSDNDTLADRIAEKTGADRTEVEQELDKFGRQYSGDQAAPEAPPAS